MRTEIIAIVDRSGSMDDIKEDAIGGFNTFLADQQKVPGEARMTILLFDHEYGDGNAGPLYAGKPIAEAAPLNAFTFVPRGSTALLDAIGRTLNDQGARIAAEKWAEQVIVCILSDGKENASKDYKPATIKTMVKHAEAHGWHFIYLAANVDAFATGKDYGFNSALTGAFVATGAGTRVALESASLTASNLRGGGAPRLIVPGAADAAVLSFKDALERRQST